MAYKRSFRFLWIGQSLSNCGDIFYLVAVISLLHASTNSAFVLALVPFVNTFFRFFGGIVAPWVMERYPLNKVLVVALLVKTIFLCLLTLVLALFAGTISSFWVFPFLACIAFLDGWGTPARNAMLPRLVSPAELMKTNSMISVVDSIVKWGGWPAGGIFIALLNGAMLLALTCVLFVIATGMMMLIRDPMQEEKRVTAALPHDRLDTLKQGWVLIWRTPALRTVALMDLIDSIANVVWIAAILYIYVHDVLRQSEVWWGYINSAFFVGLFIGGLLSIRGEKWIQEHIHSVIWWGALLVSLFTLWFGLTSVPLLSLVVSSLVGVASEMKAISQQTVVQLSTSDDLLPQVFSARDAILTGAFGASSLLFGWLVDQFGIKAVFVLAALLLAFSAAWAYQRRQHLQLVPYQPVSHT